MPNTAIRNQMDIEQQAFAVVRERGSVKMESHEDADSAGTQIAAIEANEEASAGENLEKQNTYGVSAYPDFGVTSFAELEDLRQAAMNANHVDGLTEHFQIIAGNIMRDPDIENKEAALNALVSELSVRMQEEVNTKEVFDGQEFLDVLADDTLEKSAIKRENGLDFPPRDFAYAPDVSKPSTWKLRLTEAPGRVTKAQLARAAAALSSGGFRGNRAQIPSTAMAAVKRRIRAEYRKLGVTESVIPPSVKSVKQSPLMLWKEETGQYRWLAIYSNNFRDNDNPPEIISKESHENFVKMVDAGEADYPEMWHWHIPGTAWGKAEMVDYVDGFAIAAGYVYPGHEKEAEALMDRDDILLSHGMPMDSITRDAKDRSVIRTHITQEISDLLNSAAANKLTGFVIYGKEVEMPLQDKKREYLRGVGFAEDDIVSLEKTLSDLAQTADQSGIESKEADEISEDAVLDAQATPEAEVTPEIEEGETKEESVSEDAAPLATKEEVVQLFSEVTMPIVEALRSIKERLDVQDARLAELSATDAQKIADLKEVTPTASQMSLSDIIRMNIIGKEEARVDGRTSLGKDGPEETKAPGSFVTGVEFLDELLKEK